MCAHLWCLAEVRHKPEEAHLIFDCWTVLHFVALSLFCVTDHIRCIHVVASALMPLWTISAPGMVVLDWWIIRGLVWQVGLQAEYMMRYQLVVHYGGSAKCPRCRSVVNIDHLSGSETAAGQIFLSKDDSHSCVIVLKYFDNFAVIGHESLRQARDVPTWVRCGAANQSVSESFRHDWTTRHKKDKPHNRRDCLHT